jgi:WhiB family transcriptional regulator, redox-sensing transcriptional regulator
MRQEVISLPQRFDLDRDPEWSTWPERALCRDMPDVQAKMFERGEAQDTAKLICRGCPVRTECLADALDARIEFGVWGGLTERERRMLLRRRPDVRSWHDVLMEARERHETKKLSTSGSFNLTAKYLAELYALTYETVDLWVIEGKIKLRGQTSIIEEIDSDIVNEWLNVIRDPQQVSLPPYWKNYFQDVKNRNIVEVSRPEQVIERAVAEVQPPALPEQQHPAPDTESTLGAIGAEVALLTEVINGLRERDVALTVTEVETVINGLRAIARKGDKAAWQLGLHAVQKGLISQVKLAELLGSSSATVSRRYREASDTTKELD